MAEEPLRDGKDPTNHRGQDFPVKYSKMRGVHPTPTSTKTISK